MPFNFRFQHLCGAVYSRGNVAFTSDGNTLLSPVGNRVTAFDLVQHTSATLPFEARTTIRAMALSHDSRLLLVVDEDGHSVLLNFRRRIVLHRFNFKQRVRALKFSPDDKYVALSHGKHVQVWRAPGLRREFAPFVLHRTYTGHHDDVVTLDWSRDSQFFVSGSRDATARLHSLHPQPGFEPVAFSAQHDAVVGAYFSKAHDQLYTVARDGAAYVWEYDVLEEGAEDEFDEEAERAAARGSAAGRVALAARKKAALRAEKRQRVAAPGGGSDEEEDEEEEEEEEEEDGSSSGSGSGSSSSSSSSSSGSEDEDDEEEGVPATKELSVPARAHWRLKEKHFFKQNHAKVTCCTFHQPTSLLVVGFDSGIFGLYEMPSATNVHTLSISQHAIDAVAVNPSGEWLAFGSAKLGQLLVWEWQSETYALKQQGHFAEPNALAYSSDGQLLATGGVDAKVKLWNVHTGFCFVTFTEHTSSVTDVAFTGKGRAKAVLSASLDGTVRAYDLVRYRNFRTLTTPTPTQFYSLAVDGSGEVVCAGSMAPFAIYVWSLQTGRLLDVLHGHEGPIACLAFDPGGTTLASASWDHTIKVWDVYKGSAATETWETKSDVLSLAWRPDGRELASSTLHGHVLLWDVGEGEVKRSIDGRRDIVGGRLQSDRTSAENASGGKCFTSLCYSADGTCIIAAGRSKYVCIYETSQSLLLKKYQISHNRALDGVLNQLNSKRMTDVGVAIDEFDLDEGSDEEGIGELLPGAKRSDDPGVRGKRRAVCVQSVRFSPTGRQWSCASTEGLLIYALDEDLVFDPVDLSVDVTPAAVRLAVARREHGRALLLALQLNEREPLREALEAVPLASVELVAKNVSVGYLQRLLDLLAERIGDSPHLEFHLRWLLALQGAFGTYLRSPAAAPRLMRTFRALQKSVARHQDDLTRLCSDNRYTMEFIASGCHGSDAEAAAGGGAAAAAVAAGGGAGGGAGAAAQKKTTTGTKRKKI